jgi:hypothetical protein
VRAHAACLANGLLFRQETTPAAMSFPDWFPNLFPCNAELHFRPSPGTRAVSVRSLPRFEKRGCCTRTAIDCTKFPCPGVMPRGDAQGFKLCPPCRWRGTTASARALSLIHHREPQFFKRRLRQWQKRRKLRCALDDGSIGLGNLNGTSIPTYSSMRTTSMPPPNARQQAAFFTSCGTSGSAC